MYNESEEIKIEMKICLNHLISSGNILPMLRQKRPIVECPDVIHTILLYLDTEQLIPFAESHQMNMSMKFKHNIAFHRNRGDSHYTTKNATYGKDDNYYSMKKYELHKRKYTEYILNRFPNVSTTGVCVDPDISILRKFPSCVQSLVLKYDWNDPYGNVKKAAKVGSAIVIPSNLYRLKHLTIIGSIRSLTFLGDTNYIEYINLHGLHADKDVNLGELNKCENLRHLKLRNCGDLASLPVLPTKLQRLDLEDMYFLTDVSAMVLCTNLRKVSFVHCKVLYDVSCIAFCRKIRHFMAKCCPFGDIRFLSQFEGLTKCHLWCLENVVDLPPLNARIRCMRLEYCEKISTFDTISRYKALNFLEISGGKMVAMPELECVNLKAILLSGCENLMDLTGLAKCVNLQYVILRCCSSLRTLDGLNCRPEMVDLIGCDNLTNVGALHCRNIENIRFEISGLGYSGKRLCLRTFVRVRRSLGKIGKKLKHVGRKSENVSSKYVPEEVRSFMNQR